MAFDYHLDPDSGLPHVMTPSGPLPLPLTKSDLDAIGGNHVDPLRPADRAAFAGPGAEDESYDDRLARERLQRDQAAADAPQEQAAAAPPPLPPGLVAAGKATDAQLRAEAAERARAKTGAVDPSELETPPAQQQQTGTAGARQQLLEQVGAEALRGAGGPVREQQYLKGQKEKFEAYQGAPDPELAKKIDQEQTAAFDAQGKELEAQQRRNDAAQALREQQAAQARQDYLTERAQREQTNQRLQQLSQVRQQREQEAAALKTPDMQDFWKSRGMTANITSAISVALGGYLQGMRGGSNPGLDMLNQGIDRWVAQQREEYQRARTRVSDADNAFKEALSLYGSPDQAEADLRLRANSVISTQIQNIVEQNKSSLDMANAQNLLRQLQIQRDQLKAQAQMGAKVEIERDIATRMTGGGGGGTLGMLEKQARAAKAIREISGERPGAEVKFPDGTTGYAASSEQAGKLQEQVASSHRVSAISEELTRLTQGVSDRGDPKKLGRAKALMNELKIEIAKSRGVPLRGAGEYLDSEVGNPTDLTQFADRAEQLRAIGEDARRRIQNTKRYFTQEQPGAGGDEQPQGETPKSFKPADEGDD